MSLIKPAIKPALAAIALALCFSPTVASASHEGGDEMRTQRHSMHKMMHEKMKGLTTEQRKTVHLRFRECSAQAKTRSLHGHARGDFIDQCHMSAVSSL